LVETEPGAVHVTEAMLIDNPGTETYVGRSAGEGMQPVTLRLGIPAEFERITFEEEQFGRQFAAIDGKLSTGIPWMPGQRWMRFTYTLRSEDADRVWQRSLDLPCENLAVRVRHDKLDEVSSNLGPGVIRGDERVFESAGASLEQGHPLEVNFGALPVPWFLTARWIALGTLVAMITAAIVVTRRKRPGDDRAFTSHTTASPPVSDRLRGTASGKQRRTGKRRSAA
jgi:hypothetical protein